MTAPCPHCHGRRVTHEVFRPAGTYAWPITVASSCEFCVGTGVAMTFHERFALLDEMRAGLEAGR
ncbi:MAG: hypothetical protein IPM06_21155 [Rhizobiales bacterium]|nr:hypothetical protein [Hyphomicrobiales bacterium]